MSVVKLKKDEQTKMKGLSKAISIIAKIGKIMTLICIPIVIICMIMLGFIINKVDIVDNEIRWDGKDKISIVEENNHLSFKVDGTVLAETADQDEIIKIKEFLESNSKLTVLGCVETGFVLSIVWLVLINIMLKALENLFTNINRNDTPFTLENIGHIKKIAYLMILATILPGIGAIVFAILLKMPINVEFEMFSLIEILFLFSIKFIFQYGYEIQLDSKGKMYGEESE